MVQDVLNDGRSDTCGNVCLAQRTLAVGTVIVPRRFADSALFLVFSSPLARRPPNLRASGTATGARVRAPIPGR
jgi:hypothetical protein